MHFPVVSEWKTSSTQNVRHQSHIKRIDNITLDHIGLDDHFSAANGICFSAEEEEEV